MNILSIKYKHGKSFGNNHSETIPFCVIHESNNIVEKTTFIIISQFNDCEPYYIQNEISNSEYNTYNYMTEVYGYSEKDFLICSKEEYSWEHDEFDRIYPVIFEFIKSLYLINSEK